VLSWRQKAVQTAETRGPARVYEATTRSLRAALHAFAEHGYDGNVAAYAQRRAGAQPRQPSTSGFRSKEQLWYGRGRS